MSGLTVGLSDGSPAIQLNSVKLTVPQIINNSISFFYKVFVDTGQSVSPRFIFTNNAPRMKVLFGDGSSPKPVSSGIDVSHTYYAAGLYTITLLGPSQEVYLEKINIAGDHYIIPNSWFELLQFNRLNQLDDIWVIGYGEVEKIKIGR